MTGAVRKKPRFLTKFNSGVVELISDVKVCLEKHSNCRGLGRVTLREGGETIMAGIVVQLLE